MDSQELARRLLEIARGKKTAEAGPLDVTITERACWLDGEECPYGRPEGQFLKRPRVDCKPKTKRSMGCSKLSENSDELDDLMREDVRESIEEEVSEKVSKATTSVSNELSALADDAEGDQAKEVLKLAAELIKGGCGAEDRKIVLLTDLHLDIELHSG